MYLTRVPPSEGRDHVASVIFRRNASIKGIGAIEPRTEICIALKVWPGAVQDFTSQAEGRSVLLYQGSINLNLIPWDVIDLT